MKKLTTAGIVAAALVIAAAAFAQAPTTTTAPAKTSKLKALMAKLHHPKAPASTSASGLATGRRKHSPIMAAKSGQIVGNTRTHVYHLPGSGGAMPSAANSIYFKTEAQAIAAGYHKAGVGGKKPKK